MHTLTENEPTPLYSIEPDETGNRHFRVYNFEGSVPTQSDFWYRTAKTITLLPL